MKIDSKVIDKIKSNDKIYKKELLNDNAFLEKEFVTSFKNYEKNLLTRTSFEISLWIESNEKHLSSIGKVNTTKYKVGDIVLIDLGWNNYDKEFAYIHPAVIIKNTYNRIFIVPCTSGEPRKDKNNKVFPEYLTATPNDGFEKNSVLMLYDAKFVDKNRVISKIGHVTDAFFDELYNKLFKELFESKSYEIEKLNDQIEKMNKSTISE